MEKHPKEAAAACYNLIKALTLSPRNAEKPASPTVTNFRKAEIPVCMSFDFFQ